MIRRRLRLPCLRAIALAAWLSCITATDGAAAPPGINLSWSDCGAFGQQDRVFACDTNVGSHTLVGSFSSPVALDSLNGNEVVVDIQSAATLVPPWWEIRNYNNGAVGCRNTAGLANFNFVAGPFNCHDYWQGQALGGTSSLIPINGIPNRVRVLVVVAIPNEQVGSVPLEAGLETYSFKLVISSIKTVGAGACGGCMDQADIVLTSIKLTLPYTYGGGTYPRDVLLTQPSTRNYVYWRPGVVATRNTTWGAIKSMYR